MNRDKRLVGILSLGDLALADGQPEAATGALCGISELGGQHTQAADGANRLVQAARSAAGLAHRGAA